MDFDSSFAAASHYLQSDSIEKMDEDEDYACWEGTNGYVTILRDDDDRWSIDRLSSNFEDSSMEEPEWWADDSGGW